MGHCNARTGGVVEELEQITMMLRHGRRCGCEAEVVREFGMQRANHAASVFEAAEYAVEEWCMPKPERKIKRNILRGERREQAIERLREVRNASQVAREFDCGRDQISALAKAYDIELVVAGRPKRAAK